MPEVIPFFDIEAVARTDIPKEALPKFKPPANIKDKKKIEEREVEFYKKLPEKLAVDPFYAKIICIQFYLGSKLGSKTDTYIGAIADEAECLKLFWDIAKKYEANLGGFNIYGYDLPLILTRSIQLGIKSTINIDLNKYRRTFHDVMYALCNNDLSKAKGLDTYARLFNVGNKTLEASDIPKLVEEENWGLIEEYCRNDAKLAHDLYQKVNYYFM